MNPARLIPSPDPIPASWGWFQALLLLTFVLHLLIMNTMLGSGIIALITHLRQERDTLSDARDLSGKLTTTIAFTVNSGVAPLLFLQVLYGHFFYTSSILMAVYWISVVGLLLLAYYGAYLYSLGFETPRAWRVPVLGFVVLLFLGIGFLFTNNLSLMLEPLRWKAYFENAEGLYLNLREPTLIPRYLHFVVASVAVGGLFLAWLGHLKNPDRGEIVSPQTERGLRYFTHATLFQIVIGFWFLLSLPTKIMTRFMGESLPHSVLFLAGLLGVVLSLLFGFRRRLPSATLSLLGTVVLMVFIRDLVRKGYLEPFFDVSWIPVVPQASPMLMFLCCLVLGLVIVGCVLRLGATGGRGKDG